ncbi:MAG: argininosuccinate lyase [Saccharofermentanales bacterium]|jgi:argininosuccinate lyase|nr:argininosuccinate lyase [Clostridiaceae bacterium]
MPEKLWDGRFSKATDQKVHAFNSSIAFDARLYRQDIRGSLAHAAMLADCGIISQEDEHAIREGLLDILGDLDAGRLDIDPEAEDIHMFIESELTKRIGEPGRRLHTGRSRNDQVALDLRLYLRETGAEIRSGFLRLYTTLLDLADEHLDTVMPGYTHLQRAQPITLAHHLMAYVEMIARDIGRLDDCLKRLNVMPLGSGALAGTTYPLKREKVAQALNFTAISQNSLDAVSDRDFVIELAACLAIFMMHVSRLSEEIILWASQEFAFIELDDAYSTGSSMMPQKKNPDVAELARGKTGRVYGSLMTLLTVMKGLPLAYNKDMQEDKEAIFDAVDTVQLCLPALTGMLRTMTVRRSNLARAAAGGFTNATDLADYLVGKGLSFRSAHEISGKLVSYCLERNKTLTDLELTEFKLFSPLIEQDIYDAISIANCVGRRKIPGAPAREAVCRAIEYARSRFPA